MYAAIQILEKAYREAGVMQSSPETDSYCNQIRMAINLLKKHTEKLEKIIEKELSSEK